ncbi:MAG TPA: PrsW family glutamic-type intramembrane protease [Streptosporangiaceae bacterium]|nr:PrsW family glutamic-type intramembrane protease [Streptosporangiaceae bacterium]
MNELTVIHGDQRVVLAPGQVVYIGRRDNSAVVVNDQRVSREHVRLSWGPQGWVLESVGRGGTYVSGQPVTQYMLGHAVEVRLAVPDGPAVRFEPGPVAPDGVAPGTPAAPAAAAAQPQPVPAAAVPPAMAGQQAQAQGGRVFGPLGMLIPLTDWLRDPAMRQWQRLLVVVYALVPLILLIVLQHTADLVTLGWVYCLYVAPLWAIVFWYLIRPGPVTRLHLVITAVIIVAELLLIPALTLPWERALAPPDASHNLIQWMYGVGLPEELTKALPVMVIAIVLLKVRKIKLDTRMWMFLAALSGLFFGAYEASKVYVPAAIVDIARGSAFGIPLFAERVFVDGLQHALWAGIAGFFIGLGTNYGRQRIALWTLGILVPTVLHGLNDGVLSWPSAQAEWIWILIQAFSLFLFLGYTASAARIEREVRHTPIFRGDSAYYDPSRLVQPPP